MDGGFCAMRGPLKIVAAPQARAQRSIGRPHFFRSYAVHLPNYRDMIETLHGMAG